MINLTELENWGNDLKPILFDINLALRNLEILKHSNSLKFKEEFKDVFMVLWYQQYFVLIIQLSKIFTKSDKHKRNINKLCAELQGVPLDNEILLKLETNKVKHDSHKSQEDFRNTVQNNFKELKDHKASIKLLSDLRNKVFAHTDPSAPEYILTIEELTPLVKLANKLYNSIFGKNWGQPFNPKFTSRFDFRKMIDLSNL